MSNTDKIQYIYIYEEYLSSLENLANTVDIKDMYLWPNTPIGTSDQNIIGKRCGASDFEDKNKNSRPYKVITELKNLINQKRIKQNASVLDITCADAIVISKIKYAYPNMDVYGIDCAKDDFNFGKEVIQSGIKLYKGYIQHLFKNNISKKFDIAIMFNTYRGWNSAQFKECDKNIPKLADEWFKKNVRFTFLTATKEQIKQLLNKDVNIKIIGKGESDSIMIVVSEEKISNNILKKLLNYKKYKLFL